MAKRDTTIFVISNEANNYLDTTESTTKECFAKKYGRWYNFWHSKWIFFVELIILEPIC